MRTSAIALAVLAFAAMSAAPLAAQQRQGPGGGGGGAGIEHGGGGAPGPSLGGGGGRDAGGPARGLGGDSPAAARGPEVERRAAGPERAINRSTEHRRAAGAEDRRHSQSQERSAGSADKQEKAPRRLRSYKDAPSTAEKKDKPPTEKVDRNGGSDRAGKPDRGDKGRETPAAGKQADAKPAPAERVKKVDLSDDRRGRIRDVFHHQHDLKARKDVNVRISVGRRLPRGWDYRPVPVAVIDIVPEYRDYVFVYVDDEYVICDPDDYEIVAVFPAGGEYAASGGGEGQCPASLRLSRDERELILDSVRSERPVDVRDLEIGWSVPGDVELYRFPEPVLAEAGELSACRYFLAKDQLAIVDPEDEKVVLVIDKS